MALCSTERTVAVCISRSTRRSFSSANDGAMADSAMADAKTMVTIFTVQLRCVMQDGCLAGAACDPNARQTQGSMHHNIRLLVHANVMNFPRRRKNTGNQAFHQHDRAEATIRVVPALP